MKSGPHVHVHLKMNMNNMGDHLSDPSQGQKSINNACLELIDKCLQTTALTTN